LQTYRLQHAKITELIAAYEAKRDTEEIMRLMTELQELGQPPQELLDRVGQQPEMPAGGPMGESCKMQ
jgi:hypothetical protein